MTHWETVLEPLHLSVALGESFAHGGLRISFSGPGAPVCVCICVCVCETEREKEEGKSDFLFPSLRVGLLQGSGKQSALSLAVCVCVCVCVHVWGAGTVSQEDRVCIDENPPQPFDASFPPP